MTNYPNNPGHPERRNVLQILAGKRVGYTHINPAGHTYSDGAVNAAIDVYRSMRDEVSAASITPNASTTHAEMVYAMVAAADAIDSVMADHEPVPDAEVAQAVETLRAEYSPAASADPATQAQLDLIKALRADRAWKLRHVPAGVPDAGERSWVSVPDAARLVVIEERGYAAMTAPVTSKARASQIIDELRLWVTSPGARMTLDGQEHMTAAECAEMVGVKPSTWRGWVARGQAPKPSRRLDARTPLWSKAEVEEWHSQRPGRGHWGKR